MKSIEQEHKDKYMQNKLRDCFPPDPQYCINKIFEVLSLIEVKDQLESAPQRIGLENRISLAFSHTNTLLKAINEFNSEFSKRGLQDIHVYNKIDDSTYPLTKLKEYFSSMSKSPINLQDAYAYADSAEKHILDLIKHATYLDSEYLNR